VKEEPVDLDTFRRLLGEELVNAAHRRQQTQEFTSVTRSVQQTEAESSRPLRPFGPLLIAASLVVVVGLVGLLWPSAAIADVFEISHVGDEIRLDIIDVVTDPAEVETQLREELGLASEIISLPVASELVGAIIRVGAVDDMQLQPVFSQQGGEKQIVLPDGFQGPIRIEYGRAANDGERYQHYEIASICSELWGKHPDEAQGQLRDLDVVLRYETIDELAQSQQHQTIENIPDHYRLVEIGYFSANEAFVNFAADATVIPQHPNCQ